MNTPTTRSADDMTDEEFLGFIGRPEFFHVDTSYQTSVRAIIQDDAGTYWAFIDRLAFEPNTAFLIGGSAALQINGNTIEIAIRAVPVEHKPDDLAAQPGDVTVLRKSTWQESNLTPLPREWGPQIGKYAVKLPFNPTRITLADRRPAQPTGAFY